MQELGGIVNPLYVQLAEVVEAGAVDAGSLFKIPVSVHRYEDIRTTQLTAQPFSFEEETEQPIVAHAPGHFDLCLETEVRGPMMGDLAGLDPLRIPIGYDRFHSRQLIRGTVGVLQAISLLDEEIAATANRDRNRELILNHTYQGIMSDGNPARALRRLFRQGVALAAQADAILTSDAVEGIGNGGELSKAVQEANLPAVFTLNAGSSLLSTIIRHGRRVPHPVVWSGDRSLQLSEPLLSYAAITRTQLIQEVKRARQGPTGPETELQTRKRHLKSMYGANCPAATIGVPMALRAITHVAAELPR